MNDGRAPTPSWKIAIDTGGTFTDAIGVDPEGRIHRTKVLSSSVLRAFTRPGPGSGTLRLALRGTPPPPHLFTGARCTLPGGDHGVPVLEHPEPDTIVLDSEFEVPTGGLVELRLPFGAPRFAIHLLVGGDPRQALPRMEVRVATTRATNALLEGRGAPFAMVVDRGLEDLLHIGDQTRPDLFALEIERPRLDPRVVHGLEGRLDPDGRATRPPDPAALDRIARAIKDSDVEATGVGLLHGFRNPAHESAVADALRARGVPGVITSSSLSRAEGLTARTETLAVEASVRSVMDRFLEGVLPDDAREHSRLLVMNSSGGLTEASEFLAKDGLLSGPAGGVVGAAEAARRAGVDPLLGFDMGGTSTDVSRYDGELLYRFETRVGPARVQSPCVAIETVAAGGGSICSWGDGGLSVGPRSAGSDPGPACYGTGGPLTLTDVNLLLGRADPGAFGIPIDLEAARSALRELAGRIEESGTTPPDDEALLSGLLEIANERMAQAMRSISLREGADPTEHTLVPFGGAGGQHACAIAERLGIDRILLPPDAGILSARGTLLARPERFAERTVNRPLAGTDAELRTLAATLAREATSALASPGAEVTRTLVGLRLEGQDDVLQLEWRPSSELQAAFVADFRRIHGYDPPDRPVEVAWMRVRASGERVPAVPDGPGDPGQAAPARTVSMLVAGRRTDVPVLDRAALHRRGTVEGPLMLVDEGATMVVDPGWRAEATEDGTVQCRAHAVDDGPAPTRPIPAAAGRELVAARLESIAVAMGRLLQRTALSINVKQRLDFSCALLDDQARLLVNAPHMPIHLGSMGLCVRKAIEACPPGPGEILVTNHPGCGGSHLPDVTTLAPVHAGADGPCLGYVAVRAHHAEIGGTRPGSTPPFATTLLEEGVVIPPTRLVAGGRVHLEALERLLREAPWPTRRPEENLADLRAQLAATRHGIEELRALAGSMGTTTYLQRAAGVREHAARAARRAIHALGPLDRVVEQALDDGSPLRLRVRTGDGRLLVDFTGSAPRHPGNFNAPVAIATGACVYLMRLLAGEEVPMNEGLLDPVDLVVPPGMLNPDFSGDPTDHPAVCAGNTETSQRVTDTLLLAFDLAACSQGTMNNLLFGNDSFGYYETISGGAGATRRGPGCSGVHTHMTNTRITDPEVLENRFPVLLDRFRLRRGTGGDGRFPGGDGVVRTIRARERLEVSFVSQHRRDGPYGLAGGQPGAVGTQHRIDLAGRRVPLASCDQVTLEPGESICIETPGGGGWGMPVPGDAIT